MKLQKRLERKGIRLSVINFIGKDTDIQEEPREIYSIDSALIKKKGIRVSTGNYDYNRNYPEILISTANVYLGKKTVNVYLNIRVNSAVFHAC